MSDLEPVDLTRCQGEIIVPHPFRMGGPTRTVERCDGEAAWLALELEPGPDGQRGAMSVCAGCRPRLEKLMPGRATFQAITRNATGDKR